MKKKANVETEEFTDEVVYMADGQVNEENSVVLKNINKTCCDCGAEFDITPAEQKFYNRKDYKLPARCECCRKKREVFEKHICVDCNDTFEIKLTEKEFFEKNGLNIPQRCNPCRDIKRKKNELTKQAESAE